MRANLCNLHRPLTKYCPTLGLPQKRAIPRRAKRVNDGFPKYKTRANGCKHNAHHLRDSMLTGLV